MRIVDPSALAAAVKSGGLKFNPNRKLLMTLDPGETYTFEVVMPDPVTHSYPLAPGVPLPPPGGPGGPPRPPLPPGPPSNTTRPKPPSIPLPPTNGRPTPKPPPKLSELAEQGVVIGRVVTISGIKKIHYSLAPGVYTIVLTLYGERPVAAFVDEAGKYALTTDYVFYMDPSGYRP